MTKRPRRRAHGGATIVTPIVAASVATVALAVTSPSPAWALCPNCLSQQNQVSPELRLVGLFLFVPFVVFYVAFWAIRRAVRTSQASASSLRE